ncbi:MAG TPA: Crp/Fnr family transcriptional regulator [Campylobacterales bacterium]|nr:Crp/Fnr family transcriptional regulator [Campylobacterales bacterium]
MCKYNTLKSIPIFEQLESSEIRHLSNISTIRKIEDKNILFYQGDASVHLHIVLKGNIEVFKSHVNGKIVVLKKFAPFEFIAEVSNYKNMPFPASARAKGYAEVLSIDYEKFQNSFLNHPLLVPQILSSMADKIMNLEKIVSSHLVMDATQRVAHYIYEHESEFNTIKHHKIAEKLYITPVTFSRILRKFKEEKIITLTQNGYKIERELLKKQLS